MSKFRAEDDEEPKPMEEAKIIEKQIDEEENEGEEGQTCKDESEFAEMEEIYIPQAEYTSVCNADFLPMVCNEFVTEFLDKEHGAC